MSRIVKNAILSAALAATTLASMPMAEAGERWSRHDRRVVRQQDDAGGLVAAGIFGLAAGAIAAGIIASNRPPAGPVYGNPYRHPRPQPERDYFPAAPEPAYAGYDSDAYAYEPWSREWYRYCARRYRSFDPASGTFTAYTGERRFCVAE